MPVRAATLVGDPEGAKIPFLEHMQGQTVRGRSGARGGMDRADIAIKHKVRDPLLRDKLFQMRRPCRDRVGVCDIVIRVAPEKCVTSVKADPPDLGPGGAQQAGEAVEERTMWPLQQKKDPRRCRRGSRFC